MKLNPEHLIFFVPVGFVVFFVWAMSYIFGVEKPVPVRNYGCEQVYKIPPVWRCGQYGNRDVDKHILYHEAWAVKGTEDYYITKEPN